MKAVLLSIKPEYCELIASGKKTVEIRKDRPKIDTPFKCYIYCTKGGNPLIPPHLNCSTYTIHKQNGRKKWKGNYDDSDYKYLNGKIIGEFVCDCIDKYNAEFWEDDDCYQDIRLVWENEDSDYEVEEEYRIITSNEREKPDDCYLCKEICLTFDEIKKYVGTGDKTFYAWHISEIVIYDKPKELSEFRKPCIDKYEYCVGCKYGHIQYPSWVETSEDSDGVCYDIVCLNRLTRPPQNWCYVEKLEDAE